MSDNFHNFDSNGAGGDDSQDIIMASPSQSSPMANSNSNSTGAGTGTAGGNSSTMQNNAGSSSSGNSASSNTKSLTAGESQPVFDRHSIFGHRRP